MDFHTLCTGCRTYRRFKQKQIPEEILDELLENARIANSAMNGQPLRYVLVKTLKQCGKSSRASILPPPSPKSWDSRKKANSPPLLSFYVRKDGKPRGQA